MHIMQRLGKLLNLINYRQCANGIVKSCKHQITVEASLSSNHSYDAHWSGKYDLELYYTVLYKEKFFTATGGM